MKNPILITLQDNTHVEIGDPFILRHNGKYYLYPSTSNEDEGIRCFLSEDLVSFKDMGLVAKSPLLKHAYAPEVIYKDDEFILATSPRGNGHYFLKSTSPLGPFYFVSENVQNMIDGSFVNDRNNKLHFLRADHNGIAFLDYKNNALTNRKDILPQISKAWTEGPSITYFKDYYYATFCGNDVLSKNYRIKIASSKFLDSDYKVQDYPLLLSTKEGFSALGHNSVVLGPSLDEYFVAYHKLDWLSPNQTTRYLCLDRLYINKRDCACNYSNFEIPSPKRPYFECDVSINNKLIKEDNFLLSEEKTLSDFTAEFNFKGTTSIIISYENNKDYTLLSLENNNLILTSVLNGVPKKEIEKKLKFNFNHFHSIRIINDITCEILLDNIPLFKCKKRKKGRIGYLYKEFGLYYTAFTNSVYLNSLKNQPFVIPGKIEANYLSHQEKINNEEIDSILLKKDEYEKITILAPESKNYRLYAKMKNKSALLEISSTNNSITTSIIKNQNDYKFSARYLGELYLSKNDEITIKIIKGSLEFQYLFIEPILEKQEKISPLSLTQKGELYLFASYSPSQTLSFTKTVDTGDNLFGLILNSKDFCSWHSVKDIKYHGYFVGFENDLLIVDYVQYDRTRIYDKPFKIKLNKNYSLKVEFLENIIKVYVNDKLEIQTNLKYDTCYGQCGVFKSRHSKIKLLNYKEEQYET